MNRVTISNLTTIENAKAIAKKIWEKYSSGGVISQNAITSMMIDANQPLVKNNHQKNSYIPSKQDIKNYSIILDHDQDGRISYKDFQALALKYFCGQQNSKNKGPVLTRKLTTTAKERLAVAVRLFKKYDEDESGYLQQNQVPRVIEETYRIMGVNYKPSREDVRSWMKMTDTDGDGRVTLEQYQNLVIRSLERCGIEIYE